MLRRILFFLAVNILVVLTLSLILNFLGIQPYLTQHGIDYPSLMAFCLVWGMGGAFISLMLSRITAKWLMKIKVITEETTEPELLELASLVERLSEEAGLPCPEIGIFQSEEVNAFATGPTKKRALVAVSTGLLLKMNPGQIEGVIAHELAHIKNGDMVTMTLIQGVVNAFVMFLARVLAYALSGLGRQGSKSSTGSYLSYRLFVFVFEIAFLLLGSVVVAWFSRQREFRADKGGALVAGKEKMVSALEKLKELQRFKDTSMKPALSTLMISAIYKKGLLSLFATHPSLEKRIQRLQKLEVLEVLSES